MPPITGDSPAPATPGTEPSATDGAANNGTIQKEMYVADGDYIQDIEVNDLRNRYLVTKASTQTMVRPPRKCVRKSRELTNVID